MECCRIDQAQTRPPRWAFALNPGVRETSQGNTCCGRRSWTRLQSRPWSRPSKESYSFLSRASSHEYQSNMNRWSWAMCKVRMRVERSKGDHREIPGGSGLRACPMVSARDEIVGIRRSRPWQQGGGEWRRRARPLPPHGRLFEPLHATLPLRMALLVLGGECFATSRWPSPSG
jgi:hypothetical protein